MEDNRKTLCLAQGGSHAYGLSTPSSDIDLRGIFVNTDIEHLVGLKRDEILVEQTAEKDNVMTEFRHAIRLLKGANTQMVELLFQEDFQTVDPIWKEVQAARSQLISSEKLYTCLRGYMQGELRLANGERTGKLGGKRKAAIDAYGFSPKNFVQLYRLAWAGTTYFRKGYFPVNVRRENPDMADMLLLIKTEPQKFEREMLNFKAKELEAELDRVFHHQRTFDTQFSEDKANELCLKVYGPLIAKL